MSGEKRKDSPKDAPHGKSPASPAKRALPIVKPKDDGAELDLDVGEAEPDRRYGREDIADK